MSSAVVSTIACRPTHLAPAGWLALEPARDRLNLLQLDLPQFAAGGAGATAATAWVLDDRSP